MSSEGCRLFGTDLFIEPACPLERLRSDLAAILPLAARDVVLWDETDAAFWDAFGDRNVARLHRLPAAGNLCWKADLDFVTPIPIARMQALAEAVGGAVALARDTAFPDEAGTMAGEGYVIFRPGRPPCAGSVLGAETDPEADLVYDWRMVDEPLPPLDGSDAPGGAAR